MRKKIGFKLYMAKLWLARLPDRACRWLAFKLPRRLVLWSTIRLGAHATTGKYGATVVPELGFMEAVDRWSK
jgi:hypothetical protein